MYSRSLHTKKRYYSKKVKDQQLSWLLLPVSVLFVEWASWLYLFGFSFHIGLVYMPLLSFAGGFLLTFLIMFLPQRAQMPVVAVLLGVIGAYFSFHLVYYSIFRSFFSFQTLGLAAAVTSFWKQTLMGILKSSYKIVTMFVPLAVLLIFRRRYQLPEQGESVHLFSGLLAAMLTAVSVLSVLLPSGSRATLLHMQNDVDKAYRSFGIGLASGADAFQSAFGQWGEVIDNPYDDSSTASTPVSPDRPKPIEYNELPIDFDALVAEESDATIADLHRYVSSVPATKKNQYTGMFKGKNLIFLSIEGFSDKMIDPTLTPTLYKMANEGFRFTQFYDPLWGGSTATGEYTNITGNFYNTATCLKKSGTTLTYSALGNMFKKAGYVTYGYHNNTYTYYSRHISHPNFGYTYYGIGNGLTVPYNGWPRSDREMAEATIDQYINSTQPFHAYYMTVSGHANYTWSGNSMSSWHEDRTTGLPYSENVKAYIASELEVEDMLTVLVERLTAAGKLDDTVFAMCCDHYPYALSDSELSELYGLDEKNIHNNYELYRNGFILWSSSMNAPVTVDAPCASYDIVPTLYNLFGMEYDSRLITGTDILSDTENVVIINTLSSGGSWNWITEKGRYSTVTRQFTPAEGCSMTEEETNAYVSSVQRRVSAMRTYSFALLDKDYYRHVFDDTFTPRKVLAQ